MPSTNSKSPKVSTSKFDIVKWPPETGFRGVRLIGGPMDGQIVPWGPAGKYFFAQWQAPGGFVYAINSDGETATFDEADWIERTLSYEVVYGQESVCTSTYGFSTTL